ncbi:MAG: ThiF family adenylyltransferase [Nitrososphaerota archaeon]|nr:ThiF family adenylyltransferase [Nitrososphaerota archaeon]
MKLPDNRIMIGFQFPMAVEIRDDGEDTIWRVLSLVDGRNTIKEIIDSCSGLNPPIGARNVNHILETLFSKGLLEDTTEPIPKELTAKDLQRFDRSFNYFSLADHTPGHSKYDNQVKLKRSKVVIIGLGGAGSAVASSLAAAGVGELVLADNDVVQLSNLNRQMIYDENDLGKLKVERASLKLGMLNSDIRIYGHNSMISSAGDIEKLIDGANAFVLAADTPEEIGGWSNRAALATNTPWFECGYDGPRIVVTGYVPYKTGCAECRKILAKRANPLVDLADSHTKPNAVIGPVAAISGQFCALDVIHFLTGMQTNVVGKVMVQNSVVFDDLTMLEFHKLPECPVCNSLGAKAVLEEA